MQRPHCSVPLREREHPPTHPPAAAAGGRPLTRPRWGTHMANDRPLRLSRTDEDARHVPSNPPLRGPPSGFTDGEDHVFPRWEESLTLCQTAAIHIYLLFYLVL
jgi:hypothetical protein